MIYIYIHNTISRWFNSPTLPPQLPLQASPSEEMSPPLSPPVSPPAPPEPKRTKRPPEPRVSILGTQGPKKNMVSWLIEL